MDSKEWKEKAETEGRKGRPYQWNDADGNTITSFPYTLTDGTVVGVPQTPGYGVEVQHPDGRVEYP
jgi:hypothetical protein